VARVLKVKGNDGKADMTEYAEYDDSGYEEEAYVAETYEEPVAETYEEPVVEETYEEPVAETYEEPPAEAYVAEEQPAPSAAEQHAETYEELPAEGDVAQQPVEAPTPVPVEEPATVEVAATPDETALEEEIPLEDEGFAQEVEPGLEPARGVEGWEATEASTDETVVYDPEPLPLDPDPAAELAAEGEAEVTGGEQPGLYDMPETGGYASTGWWASTEEPCHCCVVPPEVANTSAERRPAELTFASGGEVNALSGYDGNGDGMVDIAGLDANGDGRVDTWLADTTGDGVAHVMLIDTDGDGVPDAVSFDPGGAGGWSAPEGLSSLPAPSPPSAVTPAPAAQPDIGNYSTLFDQGETVTIGGHPAGSYGGLFQPSESVLLPGTDGGAYAGLFDRGDSIAISPAGLSGPLLNLVNPGAWNPFPDNPNAGPEISLGRDGGRGGEVDLGANHEINRLHFRGNLNGLLR
jgi:hypothetical protein